MIRLREDRPATIDEHRALRDEIERLREQLGKAQYERLEDCEAEIERLRGQNAELLAALKTFVQWGDDQPYEPLPSDQARAAIARAEGKT
jgi:hypothetical protein